MLVFFITIFLIFLFIRFLILDIISFMANTSNKNKKTTTSSTSNTTKKRGRPPKNKTTYNDEMKPYYSKSSSTKSKKSKKNSALKTCLISLAVVLCIGAIGVGGYYLYQNGYFNNTNKPTPDPTPTPTPDQDSDDKKDDSVFNYDSPNVSTLISNSKYSIDSSSVFYQYSKEEIKNYYKDIDFSKDKETISVSLFNLLN